MSGVTGIKELNVHHLTLVEKGWLRAFSFTKRHRILLQSEDMEDFPGSVSTCFP